MWLKLVWWCGPKEEDGHIKYNLSVTLKGSRVLKCNSNMWLKLVRLCGPKEEDGHIKYNLSVSLKGNEA